MKSIGGRSLGFACTLLAALALSSLQSGAAPAAPATSQPGAAAHTFKIGENDFLLDGQRFQIRCGEVHAARVPREYWRHRLQMVRAMGLNTVCAYLFWNMHEPQPGKYNWEGQADVAEFCRIAQQEGLWVILRPGPYACAEWEMGGFPWWLLKEDDIKLRTRDPRYLAAAQRYLKEVGRVLAPLQVTHGGPILMVQVENEYGFYGKDAEYMGVLRQTLIDAGFDVTLFACNPVEHLRDGYRADLFPVVNFGSNPANAFKVLRQILPKGPLMCGEFYPGWFDTWGAPHHTGDMNRYMTDLEYMLKNGMSFSIYMAHGGSTFGLWSGADRPFKPDTSSYDYDAPISEAGWDTDKFDKTRDLMKQYLLPSENITEPPDRNPVMKFAAVTASKFAYAPGDRHEPIDDTAPHNFEHYGLGYGYVIYKTKMPAGAAATLEATDVHDYGYVYLGGERVGVMDRRNHSFKVKLPERQTEQEVSIFVEAAGRVNFGPEVHDRKGLYGPVRLNQADGSKTELSGDWQVYLFALDDETASTVRFIQEPQGRSGFYQVTVNIDTPADTFLDMSKWGKGVVWVNNHCLGRFWSIGPTQTMYVPGPWLKKGENQIVVLDFLGTKTPTIAGLDHPILDQLHPENDFAQQARPKVTLALEGITPAITGSFTKGTDLQEVKLPAAATGRYFCIEATSSQDGKPYAAIAELTLLDAAGKPISQNGWTVAYVDSEERSREDGSAENAIDGQTTSFWHTQWGDAKPDFPHRLVLDLGQAQTISGFRYVPRQGDASVGGRIKDYCVYVSDALIKR